MIECMRQVFLMSDIEILYVCNGANECTKTDCYHKTPHSRNVGCGISCAGGVPGAVCIESIFKVKMDKEQAQELLNVISMAAGEGIEYDFTEDLAEKLGNFIDGDV